MLGLRGSLADQDGVGVLDDQAVDMGQELVSLPGAHQHLQGQCNQVSQVLRGAVKQQSPCTWTVCYRVAP